MVKRAWELKTPELQGNLHASKMTWWDEWSRKSACLKNKLISPKIWIYFPFCIVCFSIGSLSCHHHQSAKLIRKVLFLTGNTCRFFLLLSLAQIGLPGPKIWIWISLRGKWIYPICIFGSWFLSLPFYKLQINGLSWCHERKPKSSSLLANEIDFFFLLFWFWKENNQNIRQGKKQITSNATCEVQRAACWKGKTKHIWEVLGSNSGSNISAGRVVCYCEELIFAYFTGQPFES